MLNLCVFCTFSTFVQKIFEGWGWNFTRTFGKVICSKSIKMVFIASIISLLIMHDLCIFFLFKNHFWPKIIFPINPINPINFTTWGPLYACLVLDCIWETKTHDLICYNESHLEISCQTSAIKALTRCCMLAMAWFCFSRT